MKKLFTFLSVIMIATFVFGQDFQRMSYQMVVRNAENKLVANQYITLKLSVVYGSVDGYVVYEEKHSPKTDDNGLVSVEIGTNEDFSDIDWGKGVYYLKVEVDPDGNSNYTITGTTKLLAVPYAFYTKVAERAEKGPYQGVDVSPRIASRGQKLSVSFVGGDELIFSQASSCISQASSTLLQPNVVFSQGSSTISPESIYYIDAKRFDAVFNIPTYVTAGEYDIILSPSTSCSYIIKSSFKIY